MTSKKSGREGEEQKQIDRARRILRTSAAKSAGDLCAKALILKGENISLGVSAFVLGANIHSVKRWRANKVKSNSKGRPSYLTSEESELLAASIVSADSHHEPLDAKEVQKLVWLLFSSTYFSFAPRSISLFFLDLVQTP